MTTRYLGIVPARAGSKGVPDKNVEAIGGKPMAAWTFEAATGAERLDEIVVTSDDPRVLRLAGGAGIERRLDRPERLAGDRVGMVPVLEHALEWYERETDATPSHLVLLQPTSPFRTSADVDAALARYEAEGSGSLVSACRVTQHPRECFFRDPGSGELRFSLPEDADGRQDFEDALFLDGAIYVTAVDRFREEGTLFDERSAVHLLPKSHAIDVDEPFDLAVARALAHYAEHVDAGVLDR